MTWHHDRTRTRRRCGRRALVKPAGALVVAALLGTGRASTGAAAVPTVEPAAIALTPDDLPPVFEVDPRLTKDSLLAKVGPLHQRGLARRLTPPTLPPGPIWVLQRIVRLDGPMGAGDALLRERDIWTTGMSYTLTSDGPNDEGTFSLERRMNGEVIYAVGFIKENVIIVTHAGGYVDVSFTTVLDLAGISSAKLDAALGR